MPSFYIPARDSRHRASCFALYRALLRQVPRISLPSELTSRPGWINPIHYLIRSGFRRNKGDTSFRLVTSALQSGYRFLTLLVRAQDAASASHTELITFLRDRQQAFPPPRLLPHAVKPQPEREPKTRPPPLLTRVSKPGEPPVYKPTVRPLPLSELSGGTRKVPVLEDAQGVPFLRIGKPQSHAHSNFLKHKAARRQTRITFLQKLWDERRLEAAEEDRWEATLADLADREGLDIPDIGHEGDHVRVGKLQAGPYEWAVREFGISYVSARLTDEMVDMQARTTAMLDLVDEERRLADIEKREKKERRRAAWEEMGRQGKEYGPSDEGTSNEHSIREQFNPWERKDDAQDPFGSLSTDAWAEKAVGREIVNGQKTRGRKANSQQPQI